MKHFHIKRGEKATRQGAPKQDVIEEQGAVSVALLGSDMPGLRPKFEVEEGERVQAGQVLFRDRRHREVAYVSPISGNVATLSFGARRTLSACILTSDGEVAHSPRVVPVGADDGFAIREVLQGSGMWSAFRTRPFGRTPVPDARPEAVFVNACHASPLAPDPRIVLAGKEDVFARGLALLTKLTEGPVFLCQLPGAPLSKVDDRLEVASFSGTMAAGLSGTHIDRLRPVRAGMEVWSIGYQDVIAIGHLFETGLFMGDRVIAISGTGALPARLVRTSLGAKIAEVCQPEERACALAGDALTGRDAAYLGRFHSQITVPDGPVRQRKRFWQANQASIPSALVPTGALDHALAPDILPVPLLRALSIGDSETAERLGCLALIEEDVAALSRHCTSGSQYDVLLRLVLDDLMADAA
ncbi:MAG: hypothetical protein KJO30_00515 [Boseongicola sp.]|nr:hypothetical protein [Boseongicola sp.]